MAWPKEVDVVTADDICRRQFGDREKAYPEKCCFAGWLMHWFGHYKPEYYEAQNAAAGIIGTFNLPSWNDSWVRRNSTVARAINQTTASLGYTEGNPEA